jgi:hypothetical protein
LFDRVREHAFLTLSQADRQSTNLYLDRNVRQPQRPIGPPHQEIIADRPTLVVFVDPSPMANFEHPCRYLLYDASSGELYREADAKFPPWIRRVPETLEAFHEPIQTVLDRPDFHVRPPFHCPIIFPEGDRYAILFSGMSNTRHLNDLEFMYRTLVDIYGVNPRHIYVLNYDGTVNTQNGVPTTWPGDGTAYRIQVTGPGTRAGFEAAIDDLKGKLHALDTLLINTNNHGDWDNAPGTAKICTYPAYAGYYATDFANKIGELPSFRQLIVMMEQCHAGGFNARILAHSTASATSVASAVKESDLSYGDAHWDFFARDWTAAQAGHNPDGTPLASNPDTDGDGRIEAEEAFGYANSVHYSLDSPTFSESSEAGGDIHLGQDYVIWWWWCILLREILERHYEQLPPQEYFPKVHRMEPQLRALTADLDKTSDSLRGEVKEKLEHIVRESFSS